MTFQLSPPDRDAEHWTICPEQPGLQGTLKMAAHSCLLPSLQGQQGEISGYSVHTTPSDGVEALRQTRMDH